MMKETYITSLLSLEGRRAVVTGASSGIGRGIALSLARFGAEVALLGRRQEGLDETAARIREDGGKCTSHIVDISVEEEVERFFENYEQTHGSLDIFIANAGQNVRRELLETTTEEMDGLINTNYKGTIYGLIRAGKIMKRQRSGNIVVISSVNGISAMPNLAVYSSVKYALEGITRALAASLAEYGVRVNSCAPGVVLSAINENIYAVKENLDKKLEAIPMRKIGMPKDIGDVVACMVSDAFGFMTGTTILVDGGELLRAKQPQKLKDK